MITKCISVSIDVSAEGGRCKKGGRVRWRGENKDCATHQRKQAKGLKVKQQEG